MAYRLIEADRSRSVELQQLCSGKKYFSSKADIDGVCVELFTESRDYIEMWTDNFYHMSDSVRAHAKIFCIDDPGTDLHAEYDVPSSTMYLFNFDYYGWIKSIALGMAGNVLELSHATYSVHGAVIDVDGAGVTLIAPSKTGKTTQSWGLLTLPNTHLITDDWYFVTFGRRRPLASGSEKNCYIDADIGDVWEQYKPLVKEVRFDNKGRGIGNVRWVSGSDSVISSTSIRHIILLKRDPADGRTSYGMSAEEALEYLESHDLCNPHQLIRDDVRAGIRREFFAEYLSRCEVHMVNTVCDAKTTQSIIRGIIGGAADEDA